MIKEKVNNRIEFEYKDEQDNKRTAAFTGRWVLEDFDSYDRVQYNLALTQKEQLFVLRDGSSFDTFSRFVDMAASDAYPADLLAVVADLLGEKFVEELDI